MRETIRDLMFGNGIIDTIFYALVLALGLGAAGILASCVQDAIRAERRRQSGDQK